MSASSNSLGAFTYSVVSGPATNVGNTVTLTGIAGTVTLQASQAANGSFAAGTQNASLLVIAGSVWLGISTGSLSTLDLTGALGISWSRRLSTVAESAPLQALLGMAFDAIWKYVGCEQ